MHKNALKNKTINKKTQTPKIVDVKILNMTVRTKNNRLLCVE